MTTNHKKLDFGPKEGSSKMRFGEEECSRCANSSFRLKISYHGGLE